ncbi:MAG: MFS transporter [Negativicutes bacterium]|nr:MFS transporter [Negativicutes bacterium]
MAIIFTTYAINFADRANIGVALPFMRKEFVLSNFEAGAIASFFFLGYAITQIPAGFWFSRFGLRGLVSLSIVGFSLFTYLIGTAQSGFSLLACRLGLGVSEGPTPVGCTSTINNWFPGKEKATAVGVYIASTMFAPIVVPLICVWIAQEMGWRYIFYIFALPGFVMAAIWYWLIRTRPEDSAYVNAEEAAYIRENKASAASSATVDEKVSLGWLDRFIRAKTVPKIETNKGLFSSWNIWGDCFAYFMMVSVLYGLMTWIPSYLVNEKHYSFLKMGFVAASPWVGGLIGALLGGWVSDKLLYKRRKPTMLLTALSTVLMMIVLINLPENATLVSAALFMTGFLLNVGWPAFTAYPMGLTTGSTYPVAIAVVNSGGNLGGFFSPMIAGALLDAFKTYDYVFTYFAAAALIGFLLIMTLDEPV